MRPTIKTALNGAAFGAAIAALRITWGWIGPGRVWPYSDAIQTIYWSVVFWFAVAGAVIFVVVGNVALMLLTRIDTDSRPIFWGLRRRIAAVEELDRISGTSRKDDGRSIVAVNEGHDFTHFSKPGDIIVINSPGETEEFYKRANFWSWP